MLGWGGRGVEWRRVRLPACHTWNNSIGCLLLLFILYLFCNIVLKLGFSWSFWSTGSKSSQFYFCEIWLHYLETFIHCSFSLPFSWCFQILTHLLLSQVLNPLTTSLYVDLEIKRIGNFKKPYRYNCRPHLSSCWKDHFWCSPFLKSKFVPLVIFSFSSLFFIAKFAVIILGFLSVSQVRLWDPWWQVQWQ